jgi:hypothetical protein
MRKFSCGVIGAACSFSSHDCAGRNIFGDNASGSDHCASANVNSGKDDTPGSDACPVFNRRWLRIVLRSGSWVPVIGENSVGSDKHATPYFRVRGEKHSSTDSAAIAYGSAKSDLSA